MCGRTRILADVKSSYEITRNLAAGHVLHNRYFDGSRMHTLELLLRGVLAGLAISIPVGPVNIFCIQRTLLKGRLTGIIAGLGAGAADTIYGSIAGFSISIIISFLVRQLFWIRLVGGAV